MNIVVSNLYVFLSFFNTLAEYSHCSFSYNESQWWLGVSSYKYIKKHTKSSPYYKPDTFQVFWSHMINLCEKNKTLLKEFKTIIIN